MFVSNMLAKNCESRRLVRDACLLLLVIEVAAQAAGIERVGVHSCGIHGHTSDETARSAVDGWSGILGL